MGELEGNVALVTGAGRGIGRAEAMLLAREGAAVVVNDLGGEWDGSGSDSRPAQLVVDEIKAAGGRASANYDNVASWEGAGRLVQQAIDEFGGIDVVVNNAGILRDAMLYNMTEEAWDAVIDVHLKGHAAVSHHACAYWRAKAKAGETTRGRIINTASESGLFGMRGQANYGAAKAGIAALTQVLSREMGRYNVTANAIAPRARTRLITQSFGDAVMAAPEDANQFDQFAPENVAPLVAYLASDKASHINGQVFVVYGGAVTHMKMWSVGNTIDHGAQWSIDDLDREFAKLFDGGPTSLE